MSIKKVTLRTPYNYSHKVLDTEIFLGNEDDLIEGVVKGMRRYIEQFGDELKMGPEMRYLYRNSDKLGLHLHIPEIQVLQDVPDVLLVCDGWNNHVCKRTIRTQKNEIV